MLKERWFPSLYVMTLLTFLSLKLVLMNVFMTGRVIACLEWYPGELAFLMTQVTLDIHMLINKGILRFGVISPDLFPALCCMTLFALWFIFMRILVACYAFFELFKLIFTHDMTIIT